MFVKKIRTKNKTIEVGKHGVLRIDVNTDTMIADVYTFGGNIYQKQCKRILNNEDKCVCNSKNPYKNLY